MFGFRWAGHHRRHACRCMALVHQLAHAHLGGTLTRLADRELFDIVVTIHPTTTAMPMAAHRRVYRCPSDHFAPVAQLV